MKKFILRALLVSILSIFSTSVFAKVDPCKQRVKVAEKKVKDAETVRRKLASGTAKAQKKFDRMEQLFSRANEKKDTDKKLLEMQGYRQGFEKDLPWLGGACIAQLTLTGELTTPNGGTPITCRKGDLGGCATRCGALLIEYKGVIERLKGRESALVSAHDREIKVAGDQLEKAELAVGAATKKETEAQTKVDAAITNLEDVSNSCVS